MTPDRQSIASAGYGALSVDQIRAFLVSVAAVGLLFSVRPKTKKAKKADKVGLYGCNDDEEEIEGGVPGPHRRR